MVVLMTTDAPPSLAYSQNKSRSCSGEVPRELRAPEEKFLSLLELQDRISEARRNSQFFFRVAKTSDFHRKARQRIYRDAANDVVLAATNIEEVKEFERANKWQGSNSNSKTLTLAYTKWHDSVRVEKTTEREYVAMDHR